jgi:hypothetical protein
MVEKVQAQDATTTTTATATTPSTQSRPTTTPAVASGGGGSTPTSTGGGSASMAGPLDQLKRPDDTMGDPDGHCVSCGESLDPHTWTCPECHESVDLWNKKVDDFTTRARAYGWSDDQIRERGQQFFNEQKQATQAGAEADQTWQTAEYADSWIRNYGK